MKDERGVYYYPFVNNKRVRMYVMQVGSDTCFRLWNADDPKMWEQHGWIPYDAILQATAMYKGGGMDPNQAYDINLAREVLKESE